ncbi:hypothetical protein MMC27_001682 [Xylographa pallens]|nr:hypothetical protein [Xylographa pallens]
MASTAASTPTTNGLSPKITLYTNHSCPFAHRAHIALKELKLPYEEVIIDLDRPRDEWYLKINPVCLSPSSIISNPNLSSPQRGLVPTISFSNGVLENEIITESAIVAQFLADAFPSHLLPASHSSPTAPLTRARIAFFADAYSSKVTGKLFGAMNGTTEEEKEAKADELVATLEKEIEPLLKDAAPFFGGSDKMTMAECLTASFVLRTQAYARGGLMHSSLLGKLEKLPHYTKWQKALASQDSVMYIFDEADIIRRMKIRMEKMAATQKTAN